MDVEIRRREAVLADVRKRERLLDGQRAGVVVDLSRGVGGVRLAVKDQAARGHGVPGDVPWLPVWLEVIWL